jgi:CRP-like cAMP-binding protein
VQEASAPGQTILCDPEDADFDAMYVVSEGRIAVYLPGGYAGPPAQVRSAPTYFGEISVFFDQPRNARVTAHTPLKYYQVSGELMRALVGQNPLFSRAFASSLRNKQRIFHGFEAFMGLVTTQEAQGVVRLSDLIGSYRGLRSVLHRTDEEHRIDFDALAFTFPILTNLFHHHLYRLEFPLRHPCEWAILAENRWTHNGRRLTASPAGPVCLPEGSARISPRLLSLARHYFPENFYNAGHNVERSSAPLSPDFTLPVQELAPLRRDFILTARLGLPGSTGR